MPDAAILSDDYFNSGMLLEAIKNLVDSCGVDRLETIKNISAGLSALVDSSAMQITESQIEILQLSIKAVSDIAKQFQDSCNGLETQILVQEETLAPIREMARFVPEGQRAELEKIVAPVKEKEKILTPANIISLVALIWMIISSFIPENLSHDSMKFIHDEADRIVSAIESIQRGCSCLDTGKMYMEGGEKAAEVIVEEADISGNSATLDGQSENADTQNETNDLEE